eukprot:3938910-Rhodomonas_salina.13
MRAKTSVQNSYQERLVLGEWTEPIWSELANSEIPPPPHRILFVGSDDYHAKINVEREVREMETEFKFKRGADQWGESVIFQHTLFASKDDLVRDLRRYDPTILHFACHGEESALKLFGSDLERKHLRGAVGEWSDGGYKRLRLIIANACNSWDIVQDLAGHVDFVIGHQTPVPDSSAVAFSRHFYGSLGGGEHLRHSFNMAKVVSDQYCMNGRKNAGTFILQPAQCQSYPSPVSAASVQFPPSSLHSPSLAVPDRMAGLFAAKEASGDARQGTPQALDTPHVSPFPFVFVAGAMDAGSVQNARSVAEGWEAYGVECGRAVVLDGNWYGKGGCGSQILHLKPSILHVDARADPGSGGMLFKDGVVPYEKLCSSLSGESFGRWCQSAAARVDGEQLW